MQRVPGPLKSRVAVQTASWGPRHPPLLAQHQLQVRWGQRGPERRCPLSPGVCPLSLGVCPLETVPSPRLCVPSPQLCVPSPRVCVLRDRPCIYILCPPPTLLACYTPGQSAALPPGPCPAHLQGWTGRGRRWSCHPSWTSWRWEQGRETSEQGTSPRCLGRLGTALTFISCACTLGPWICSPDLLSTASS